VGAADGGVGDLPRDPNLAEETLQQLRVVLQRIGQELEGNGLVEEQTSPIPPRPSIPTIR
jgi:hypothetical protein